MNRTTGMRTITVLFLVFLILKLTNVISWSWWWITAPLWGSLAIGITIFTVPILITGMVIIAEFILSSLKNK